MRKDFTSNSTSTQMKEPRPDGDLRKPRIAKCTNEQEIMDLMSSVRWEHIRMGISEAALSKKDSLVPALAYLAKHGCSENLGAQLKARGEQFKDIVAIIEAERMEARGEVGRSTMTLLIPAAVMEEIRASPDPRETAQQLRKRLENYDNAERAVVRKRAMEALGEIGTPAAIAELAKLLFCTMENKDMWAASILERAARENPAEVVPVLKEAIKAFMDRPVAGDILETLDGICERAGKA